jgi:predicted alpha/beta hydrolase family esterase
MAKRVLLLHSSGPQGQGEGSAPLVDRLREELGRDFEVAFPILPAPDDPHYPPWSERLGEILAENDTPTVVVGHSLGGSVFLKHLAEGGRAEHVTGLVLLATPYWGESDWEAEWALPEGWPNPSTELPPTHLFHSRDDEEIPFSQVELYRERLPVATVHPLDGCGHLYARGDLTEVLEAIREVAPA